MVQKLVPDRFLKIKIERISESAICNFIQFTFIVCSSEGLRKYIEACADHSLFFHLKVFYKRKLWDYSGCFIFCMIFEENPFSRYAVLTDQTALRLIVFTF